MFRSELIIQNFKLHMCILYQAFIIKYKFILEKIPLIDVKVIYIKVKSLFLVNIVKVLLNIKFVKFIFCQYKYCFR